MKTKQKTKNTKAKSGKTTITKRSSTKKIDRNYPAYYLAVVLAGVLLLEGFLLGAATPQMWNDGLQILDVSSDVQVVGSDLAYVFEPMIDQVFAVEEFYQLAATEVMYLFDISDHDPLAFYRGIENFYYLASVEMEQILDFSESFAMIPQAPQVAGAAFFR